MSNTTVNWGIIGLGRMAHKFVSDLSYVPDAQLYAVASRNSSKAKLFAEEYGATLAFDNYTDLISDPNVDVIYIATPHHLHYELTLLCLSNRKAVLCEKAFALNSKHVKYMVETAKVNNVFLMEALWSRFLPHIEFVKKGFDSNKWGNIKIIDANFAFKANYNPNSRLFNPELGGGSLLDIGIYPVFLCYLLLGKPGKITAKAQLTNEGIDESIQIILEYGNGVIANLFSSFMVNSDTKAHIYTDSGNAIHFDSHFHSPGNLTIQVPNNEAEEIKFNTRGSGYNYEAIEVQNCILTNQTESEKWSLLNSIELIEILDEIRQITGIKYAVDGA